jgi:ABC-type arginine transport system permease subunit
MTDIDLLNLNATRGFKIIGAASGDTAGTSTSSAGDINADGISDVLVGASSASPSGRASAGMIYVIYGKSGGQADVDLATLSTTQGFKILGAASNDFAGRAVSNAGDINADGISDILIGAYTADPNGRVDAGTAYVIYGKSGGQVDIDLAAISATQGFKILGAVSGDTVGQSVSGAGDINADGISDLLVGASSASPSGRTRAGMIYVIYGKSGGQADVDLATLSPTQGFKILGAVSGDSAGWSVSSAGDINADGISDLLVGAYGASPSRGNAGIIYIIYGKSGGQSNVDLATLSPTQGFKILGAVSSDNAGYSVSSAGDINGDLINDVIIGALYADPSGRTDAGTAYVIYGKSGGSTDVDLSNLNPAQGFKILGAVSGDNAGYSVSSAGDINVDGISDVLVGAYQAYPNGRIDAGTAYVIYGKSGGQVDVDLAALLATQGFKILGASDSYTGYSVNSARDINADNISDILVGAYRASPGGRVNAGTVYAIYGMNTTNSPTRSPTTVGPTAIPTITPTTVVPTTSTSSSTIVPTYSGITDTPTMTSTTAAPTNIGATNSPTISPTTSTDIPTMTSITAAPTSVSATDLPTISPTIFDTTGTPTIMSATTTPTSMSTTSLPTISPTILGTTATPTTTSTTVSPTMLVSSSSHLEASWPLKLMAVTISTAVEALKQGIEFTGDYLDMSHVLSLAGLSESTDDTLFLENIS